MCCKKCIFCSILKIGVFFPGGAIFNAHTVDWKAGSEIWKAASVVTCQHPIKKEIAKRLDWVPRTLQRLMIISKVIYKINFKSSVSCQSQGIFKCTTFREVWSGETVPLISWL